MIFGEMSLLGTCIRGVVRHRKVDPTRLLPKPANKVQNRSSDHVAKNTNSTKGVPRLHSASSLSSRAPFEPVSATPQKALHDRKELCFDASTTSMQHDSCSLNFSFV